MSTGVNQKEPTNVISRLKRGLAGYVSYLAACEMNEAFSEYVLYEPMLRVLTARGYTVRCEYECPGMNRKGRGDKKRIDFYATRDSIALAIEVKWEKSKTPNIKKDLEKLKALHAVEPATYPLLLIFGVQSDLENLDLKSPDLPERSKARIADLGITRFGCRVFQFKPSKVKSKKVKVRSEL